MGALCFSSMTQSLMFRRLESFGPVFFNMSVVSIDRITVFIESHLVLNSRARYTFGLYICCGFSLLEVRICKRSLVGLSGPLAESNAGR